MNTQPNYTSLTDVTLIFFARRSETRVDASGTSLSERPLDYSLTLQKRRSIRGAKPQIKRL